MTTKKPGADGSELEKAPASNDIALIHGKTADGEGFNILRARDNRLEVGAVRPLREGAQITGEVVTLHPRPNFPALCDVETHYKPAPPVSDQQVPAAHKLSARVGPAQVATDEYRRNWDAIWSQAPDTSKKLAN